MRRPKYSASTATSPSRTRRGGKVMTSKLNRSSRSARNSPLSASAGRSSLVAATIRTSTRIGREEPMRVTSPYSTALSSRSCAPIDKVPSSSRNSVPLSASSNLPARALVAPVKAPASWPNNSASIRVSGRAAQFMVTSGSSQRVERRWRRSAISSLPVPRSPMTSTGRLIGAARGALDRVEEGAGLAYKLVFALHSSEFRSLGQSIVKIPNVWQ